MICHTTFPWCKEYNFKKRITYKYCGAEKLIFNFLNLFSIFAAVINSYYYQKAADFIDYEIKEGKYEGRDETLDFCQNLIWSNLRYSCFYYLAMYEKDQSICELLKIAEIRGCVHGVNFYINNPKK